MTDDLLQARIDDALTRFRNRTPIEVILADTFDGDGCWWAAALELDAIDRETGLDQLAGWRPLTKAPPPSSQPSRR